MNKAAGKYKFYFFMDYANRKEDWYENWFYFIARIVMFPLIKHEQKMFKGKKTYNRDDWFKDGDKKIMAFWCSIDTGKSQIDGKTDIKDLKAAGHTIDKTLLNLPAWLKEIFTETIPRIELVEKERALIANITKLCKVEQKGERDDRKDEDKAEEE